MPRVETVRGPVELDQLGRTLPHEHLFIASPEGILNFNHAWGGAIWEEEARVADAVQRLRAVVDAGYTCFVDPTGFGLGRDVPRVARVCEQVPELHYIVASGVYAFAELPSFLKYRTPELLAELFVRELTEGIDDTGIKAGFLKCCLESFGLVVDLPVIFEGVAIASKETGAPIMVHTNAEAKTGLLALETLTGHGVDPSRIVIAHAGDSNDMDYLRAIAETGASLGFDRFNIPHFNPDEQRIATLLKVLEAGWGHLVHLSHDAAAWNDFMHYNPPFADEHPDFLHIDREILPALRDRGVTQEQIDEMEVENPKRFFAPAAVRS